MNIGTKCRAHSRLKRIHEPPDHLNKVARHHWEPIPYANPLEVYYIGYRWLANGVMHDGYEHMDYTSLEPIWQPPWFEGKEHFRAALVVIDERTNPFYVPWEDLTT